MTSGSGDQETYSGGSKAAKRRMVISSASLNALNTMEYKAFNLPNAENRVWN